MLESPKCTARIGSEDPIYPPAVITASREFALHCNIQGRIGLVRFTVNATVIAVRLKDRSLAEIFDDDRSAVEGMITALAQMMMMARTVAACAAPTMMTTPAPMPRFGRTGCKDEQRDCHETDNVRAFYHRYW